MDGDVDLERSCIVTRETRDPSELIRFVRAPDGTATPDLKRKLPGRGAWISARAEIISRATPKAFSRAFRAETKIPDDLAGLVERLLRQDALQSLSLANKAGRVVTGFDQALEAVQKNRAVAVLHAREAAENGRRKLQGASRGAIEALAPFESGEMDLALGRIHVIHAALTVGAVSDACLSRCRFLLAFRGESGDGARIGEAVTEAGPGAQAGSKAE
ncbi:RNA-binding protein [Terrarubrum flagellatum]|uniref:RNA-binding protein n=1 Tax=Terrirubrum flagellatum TaxID=2895980 RepID=UPI003144FDFB